MARRLPPLAVRRPVVLRPPVLLLVLARVEVPRVPAVPAVPAAVVAAAAPVPADPLMSLVGVGTALRAVL